MLKDKCKTLLVPHAYNRLHYYWCIWLSVPVFLGLVQGGGEGVLGSIFAGYVPLASKNLFNPFIIYFMTNYRPHLSHYLFDNPNVK